MAESPRDANAERAENAQRLLQMGTGYIISAALGVAAHLKIADALGAGPRPVADLARAQGVNEDALYRVLRVLAMAGVFTESSPRAFGLTPLGEQLRSDVPGTAHAMVHWMADAFHLRVYAELSHAVQTGATVGERVVGMPVFEYFPKDAALSESFNNAMTAFSAHLAPAVLEAYDFSGIDVLVDVAGGHGMLLGAVLQRYPNMRGVLLDLEHVLAGNRLAEFGVAARARTEAVDFFKAVPTGGDAYVMKHIIHDWDDEKATAILRNVHAALQGKRDGRLILVESVVRPGDDADLAKVIDLEMLVLPGGKERTAEEFATLFRGAGFELTRVVPTASPVSVVEGRLAR